MKVLLALLACALGAALPAPSVAQSAAEAQSVADAALTERANQLPDLMAGRIAYDAYFAETFRAAVPEAQFRQVTAQLAAANGAVTTVESVTATTPFAGVVRLGYERAVANVQLAVDPAAPHLVTGLRITGAETRDDSIAKLSADLAALAGKKALLIQELGRTARPVLAIEADRAGAIGSGFKLWLLAEAARSVAAGERRWTDVVPLAADVPSSSITARWPNDTPVTLQSAATAMISVSDNRATDTVLAALGRGAVDATAQKLDADARSIPVLSTREAFALKTSATLGNQWAALADPARRRALLSGNRAAIDAKAFANSDFTAGPMRIDSVEWFASPTAMARTLDWLRTDGGDKPMAIMAVNPGIDPVLAARFAYLGFKGGSEAGVIAMNFLVRTKAGRWFAVTGHWNDTAKPVENLTFATLMSRALGLVPQN